MFIVDHAKLVGKRHKTLFIFLAILLSFIISLYLLLFTQKGFKFTLTSLHPILKSVDVTYETEGIRGNILSFHLPNLFIHTDDVDIAIEEIDISTNPFKIVLTEIGVNSLTVGKLDITINNSDTNDNENKEDDGPNKSVFPLTLIGYNAQINSINVIIDDASIVTASNLIAKQVSIINDTLQFSGVSGALYDQTIMFDQSKGDLSFKPPFVMHSSLNWTLHNENILASKLTSQLDGPLTATFKVKTMGNIETYLSRIGTIELDIVTNINKDYLLNDIQSLSFDQNLLSGDIVLDYKNSNTLFYNVNIEGKYYTESLSDIIAYQLDFQAVDENDLATQHHRFYLQNCDLNINTTASECQLEFEYNINKLSINTFTITNNTRNDNIVIYGDVLPNPNLNWQINIDQIGYYLTQISGDIRSRGSINHTWAQPLFSTHTLIDDIEYNQTELPKVLLDASFNQTSQDIQVTLSSPQIKFYTKVKANWLTNNRWQAAFLDTQLHVNKSYWYILGQPQLTLSADKFDLTNFCLTSTASHACISMLLIPGDYMFKSDIDIYHQTLSQMLPNFQTTSDLQTGFYFNTQKHVGTSLRYLVNLTPGEIELVNINQLEKKLELGSNKKDAGIIKIYKAKSQGVMENGSLSSDTQLSFNKNSFINFELKAINLTANNISDAYIDASLSAEINGLEFLSYVLKLPINIDGIVNADFKLMGSGSNTTFSGQANATNLNLDLIPLGIQANNGTINVNATSPLNLEISSDIDISNSKLLTHTNFAYDLPNNNFTVDSTIKAEKAKLVELPQLQMTVSPALNIKKRNGPLKVTGDIIINQADIYAEDFNSTANANNFSSDIVFVNNRDQIIQQNVSLPIFSEIMIDLGENTVLYGYGFHSYLTGKLKIFSSPNQLTTAYGNIGFKDGVYQNYGKRFTVEDKSNLNYNYSPITNPNLDITAMYHLPPDIMLSTTAPSQIGIKVQGTAENPKLTLFSNPSMSQSNILAYIVIGHPLQGDASQQNSNAMQSAALAFALNGGSQSVLKDIQETLGINDLSFGTMNAVPMMSDQLTNTNSQNDQNNQSQTALFIGKSITSKFYVSYGISIFTGQQEIDTVYKLNENWSIRTDYTTLDTGADLIFQITP